MYPNKCFPQCHKKAITPPTSERWRLSLANSPSLDDNKLVSVGHYSPFNPSRPSPLEVQQQLMAAKLASKKIRRAVIVALSDAWTIAIFAALSFVCGLFGGVSGVVMGVGMGVIAYFEFTGAARLRRLEPSATKMLGYNQLAFACLLILYAAWNLYDAANGGGMLGDLKSHEAELGASGKDFEDLGQMINSAIYLSLMGVAVFAQGGTALYYFSREKYLRWYIEQTPPWIIDMQKAGGPL